MRELWAKVGSRSFRVELAVWYVLALFLLLFYTLITFLWFETSQSYLTGANISLLTWENLSHTNLQQWEKWKALFFCCYLYPIFFFFLSIDTDSTDVTVFFRGTYNAPSAILTYAFTGADLLSQWRLWFPTSGSSYESHSTHGCVNEDSQWNWSLWDGG